MLILKISKESVRKFMNRLLREDVFDRFEVRSVEIQALTRIEIAGLVIANAEPDDGVQIKRYAGWAELRPLIFEIVKFGQMPSGVKIVFACDEETAAALHPNASGLFLNMAYENGEIQFTSATAQKQFALDKTLDEKWEAHLTVFFTDTGIPVENI